MTTAGARLQVHPASVTNAATRLEAAGLVARCADPADGRGVLVEITRTGRAMAAKATAALHDQVFGRPELAGPRMIALVDILRQLRQDAGDFAT
jgi:DNA-binding MarR family transcriptional regulator